jgi:hypothetical protein
VRYVKLGTVYEYFENSLKHADVMPKRSDFSATMCGKKFGVDLQTTREMGKGRHHVILGKFLKRCDESVQIRFKDVPLFGNDHVIYKHKTQKQENLKKKKEKESVPVFRTRKPVNFIKQRDRDTFF